MISFDTLSTADGRLSQHPYWKLVHSVLIVSNHSFINVLFLWGSSTYIIHINNSGQDSLTNIFQAPFLIQARLLKQKLLHDLLKIFNTNHGTISHLKCLEMATSYNNSSVTSNVMIETKLSLMNEVSVQALYKKISSCFDTYVNLCEHNLR